MATITRATSASSVTKKTTQTPMKWTILLLLCAGLGCLAFVKLPCCVLINRIRAIESENAGVADLELLRDSLGDGCTCSLLYMYHVGDLASFTLLEMGLDGVRILADALHSENASVVYDALRAVNQWVLHLYGGLKYDREPFPAMAQEEVLPALVSLLEHPEPRIRTLAVTTISYFEGDHVDAWIRKLLDDRDAAVVWAARNALTERESERAPMQN